jgi:hypothetical protein
MPPLLGRVRSFGRRTCVKADSEGHAAGLLAGEVCRKYDDATFYKWRSRYGGMEVSDARRLKALDDKTVG